MIPYVLRRLLGLVPVLWAVATLIWVCVFLLPGDDVTAPPVVTEEGRILLGCANNIYCY